MTGTAEHDERDPMPLTIIKGAPCDQWEAVQAIQAQPFLYIASNGSKGLGQEPDDLDELLLVLAQHPLRHGWGDFCEIDPCEGVRNHDRTNSNAPRWIDGPRMFGADGVRHYSGNFADISHVFSIYTNDADTVNTLDKAIADNLATTVESETP